MLKAPIPENELERLDSLHRLNLLDTPPEERFDLITRTATKIFNVPISTLTLIDAKREWFKSCQGLSEKEGDRAVSFCGQALLTDNILVIPDTKQDSRFADNPLVTKKPYIRFYAGVPILSADGQRIGVFCIKDTKPRKFSKENEEVLKGLASWAEIELNSRNLSLALSQGKKLQTELKKENNAEEKAAKKQKDTNEALLNVMEDLEATKATLETEKAKDEAIIASIGEGLIAVNNRRKITIINRATEDILGWGREELVGKIVTNLRLEDEDGSLIPLEKRPTYLALATGKTINVICYFVKKDKTRFPLAINATPIALGKKTIGLIEIIRDVSRETAIDRAKSEFVSIASHQLRTPLGITKWYLEALVKEEYFLKSPPTIHQYIDEILKSNERVLSLVRNLLSISRIEEGRVKDTQASINPIETVKAVIEQMQIVSLRQQVTLNFIIGDDAIPPIIIDSLRFHEVIENLIINALEYTLPGGNVTVNIGKVDKTISISIKDTGIGISTADQKNLFTKFFRTAKAVAQNPQGSGLGLYLVKSYVEGWGGTISVKSTEGKGSTFIISLPIPLKGHA